MPNPARSRRPVTVGFLLAGWASVGGASCRSEAPSASTLFVAASFQDAVRRLIDSRDWRPAPRLQVASSSTLARQIVRGAPADCFISADRQWVTYLEERNCLEPGHRKVLVGNRLVLVAPLGSAVIPQDLRAFAGRLALGDPSHVPAGRYGKQALEALGVWSSIVGRVVPTADVRAALALVERGEVDLGLVYATDARASARVRVVRELDGPEVLYEIALLRGGDPEALRRLVDSVAVGIYQAQGFLPIR